MLGTLNDLWFGWIIDFGSPGPDRGEGGRYLILPPDYQGPLPDGGFYIGTEERVPAFFGDGLRPIGFVDSCRQGRREPDIDGATRVGHDTFVGAINAGELLIGLQHGAGLVVVHSE